MSKRKRENGQEPESNPEKLNYEKLNDAEIKALNDALDGEKVPLEDVLNEIGMPKSKSYAMPKDYHEILSPMLESAVKVQMEGALSATGMPEHQLPDMVMAILEVEYNSKMEIDSKSSEVKSVSGAMIGDKGNKFMAPSKIGVTVLAECYNDKVVQRSMEINPSGNGVVRQDLIQTALPKLVKETIEHAKKEGKDAEKYLRTQPVSVKQLYFYAGQPSEAEEYMSVELDPDNLEVYNQMSMGLSKIKEIIETKLSDLESVRASFASKKKFSMVYGALREKDGISYIKTKTKDSRVSLEVSAKLNNGIEAKLFEAGTGGLESIRYTYFDTSDKKHNQVIIVDGFDETINAIAEHVANKLVEKDTDENVTALGQSAPIVLSQNAAGYLMWAVSMFASGTVMKDQILKEDKKTLQGKIGTSILPSFINISVNGSQASEDSTYSNRYGSQLIDAEGTPSRELKIVQNGMLKQPMLTRDTLLVVLDDAPGDLVEKIKIGETKGHRPIYEWKTQNELPLYGCARRKDYSSQIVAAPTNINVEENPDGARTLDEFVNKIGQKDKGLFIESVESVSFTTDGDICLTLDLGYFIENGHRNPEVRVNKGTVYFKYDELKNNILAISGPGTALMTPIEAQVTKGQILPISVSSPMIALSKGDFAARSKIVPYDFQNYTQKLEQHGNIAFFKKIGDERKAGLCPEAGPSIYTAVSASSKMLVDTPPKRELEDIDAVPDYVMGNDGNLIEQ